MTELEIPIDRVAVRVTRFKGDHYEPAIRSATTPVLPELALVPVAADIVDYTGTVYWHGHEGLGLFGVSGTSRVRGITSGSTFGPCSVSAAESSVDGMQSSQSRFVESCRQMTAAKPARRWLGCVSLNHLLMGIEMKKNIKVEALKVVIDEVVVKMKSGELKLEDFAYYQDETNRWRLDIIFDETVKKRSH